MDRVAPAKLAALAVLAFAALPAASQGFPARPIRIVVPWPPGGGTDIFARAIGQKMTESWRQQVIVDNRPGATGNIGAELVVKSPADGYTLLLATITIATSPAIYRSLPFDPVRDLEPITLIAGVPHLLVVHPSLPATTVRELVALARARPGQLDYASAGNGSPFHLAAELFNLLAGVRMNHIPYKGGGPAVLDTIGGQVQVTFANLLAALPHAKGGKLRPLGVTSARRSSAAPELPTLAEGGLADYDFNAWFGMLAPAGTPREVVQALNVEIVRILQSPELRQRLTKDGADVVANSPQEFASFVKSETVKWAKVIREAGIKAE